METSAVRKESETFSFQTLGRFETVGSNLRYGIPKGFATVRPHLRKVSNYIFLFIWPVFQDISWLAVEFFADGFKGGEADGFGLACLEDGEVGCRNADFVS